MLGIDPAPLATEALRGEGAHLVNERGERFIRSMHPDAELAPRDIVARGCSPKSQPAARPSSIAASPLALRFADGLSDRLRRTAAAPASIPRREPIPVAPAEHYHMGGIATDDRGRTSLPAFGPWARWRPRDCTAQTAWPPTRSLKPQYSARAPPPISLASSIEREADIS